MIDVEEVIKDIPHFEEFCSVEKLHALVEKLHTGSPGFTVEVAGTSGNGMPIHHVRFGKGSVKALVVGGPHAMEPIGSLTVFSLMTLLQMGNRALLEADVEWHIVPCIDPDGARLNEGWNQKPFTLENYMRNFYVQAPRDQVDNSFPITYKKLAVNQPSTEAKVLQRLLEKIRPDFFFSLHNALTGGAYYFISRDIGEKYYQEIYRLLDRQSFPIQKRPGWREVCAQFGEGIVEVLTIKKYYDYLEKTTASPETEELVRNGTPSTDYLADIKPEALIFIAELGYVRHPSDESEKETGRNLRQFKLRIDADSKFLATVILEEWEKVKDDLDTKSPFYRAIVGGGTVIPTKERICEGGFPLSLYPTREVLFSAKYDRTMTEGDRFSACMSDGGFLFLRFSYQCVRLLKASPQTPAVRKAIERLDQAYDAVLIEIERHVDFDAFEVVDCDTLARVQLGSGLIALNSLFERRTA